jgi:hypothetical protein
MTGHRRTRMHIIIPEEETVYYHPTEKMVQQPARVGYEAAGSGICRYASRPPVLG